jgi:hypothetical protein
MKSPRERDDELLLLVARMEIDGSELFSLITPVFPERDRSSSKTLQTIGWAKHDQRRTFKNVRRA